MLPYYALPYGRTACNRIALAPYIYPRYNRPSLCVAGELQLFEADAFAHLLADFFPSRDCDGGGSDGDGGGGGSPPQHHKIIGSGGSEHHRVLRLVFLSACYTETLGVQLRERGAECVVCWRTATHDDAARLFSVRFFQALAVRASGGAAGGEQPMTLQSPPQPTREDCIAAFDEAVEAVRSAKRRRRSRYALADPLAPGASRGGYPIAAGIPVLLCYGAAADTPWCQGGSEGRGVRLPVAQMAARQPPPIVLTGISAMSLPSAYARLRARIRGIELTQSTSSRVVLGGSSGSNGSSGSSGSSGSHGGRAAQLGGAMVPSGDSGTTRMDSQTLRLQAPPPLTASLLSTQLATGEQAGEVELRPQVPSRAAVPPLNTPFGAGRLSLDGLGDGLGDASDGESSLLGQLGAWIAAISPTTSANNSPLSTPAGLALVGCDAPSDRSYGPSAADVRRV